MTLKGHPPAKSVGQRLIELRLKLGLTQQGLAAKTGVSLASIQAQEQGIRNLGGKNAAKLAPVLGVTPAYLVWGYSDLIEVPVAGTIPTRRGLSVKQDKYTVPIPAIAFPQDGETQNMVAVEIIDDSLIGDNIHRGDYLLISLDIQLINGKIYLIKLGDEIIARHIYPENGLFRIEASNKKFPTFRVEKIEILGKVAMSGGRWITQN